MPGNKILLVCKEGEARDAYVQALDRIGIRHDIAASFMEVPCLAKEKAYSGLLLDVLTLVRTSREEKSIAYDCINFYPSTRIKWDTRKKRISLYLFEQSTSEEAETALRNFVQCHCQPFAARKLRKFNRKEITLNALLSPDSSFPDSKTDKTFTLNVSTGGCFLHTTRSIGRGETVWLRFLELADQTPIKATVCWYIEWGQKRSISGIGVRFESQTEAQAEEIGRFV